ncbi:aminoacyl-tRNA hydrolase [Bifidobacterium gallicum]|nr:aminoacyl-tRNA hydrolase [Bifidobacterium gallicum]KFI57222.1 peptidyl-tRNA hydrolase [Bifidobacterium gallicum DSM 20093 = LMG 11596]
MAAEFWLIVGLGNKGVRYEGTRHNMGFMVANELAARWQVKFSNFKGLAELGQGTMNLQGQTHKFLLAKPLTYMNNSGQAVESIAKYYHVKPDHIIVIHDDMDLEFGRIKLKSGGSAGGHNGIKSIDACLHTPDYARVRMGTGHSSRAGDAHSNSIDFVLGKFNAAQRKELPDFLADGADAAETIMFNGLQKAQDKYNAR